MTMQSAPASVSGSQVSFPIAGPDAWTFVTNVTETWSGAMVTLQQTEPNGRAVVYTLELKSSREIRPRAHETPPAAPAPGGEIPPPTLPTAESE